MIAFFVLYLGGSFDGLLLLAGYPAGTVTYHEPADSPLEGASAVLSTPLTAGTVTVTVKKNGSAVGTVSLAVGTPMAAAQLTGGLRTGDRLEVRAVSSADLDPTTAALLVVVH